MKWKLEWCQNDSRFAFFLWPCRKNELKFVFWRLICLFVKIPKIIYAVEEFLAKPPHCYKTFRKIPPPSTGWRRLILLGRGKQLLYMGREFAPSGTKVFRNHWKFPAIFTMKKGRMRMVGSNSVPLDYYAWPLPLHPVTMY